MRHLTICFLSIYYFFGISFLYAGSLPKEISNYKFERKDFKIQSKDVKFVKVFSEEDFKIKSSGKTLIFDLQNDISISYSHNFPNGMYHIKGNGYTISENNYRPRKVHSPILTRSWSVDTKKGTVTFSLPTAINRLKHTHDDSIFINYEAWYLRFKGKLIAQNETSLVCVGDKKCLSDRRFCKYTSNPYIFVEEIRTNKDKKKCLFHFGRNATVLIENTSFKNINCICINNSGRLKITNCRFENIVQGCVNSSGYLFLRKNEFVKIDNTPINSIAQSYLDIVDSFFKEIGLIGSNTACVVSKGNGYIAHNHFEDFNYSAIMLGIVNIKDENILPQSCVERNILVWTENWTEKISKYGLKDSGAIYITTNNRFCVVRNNTILNYGGHGLNRAIFCDDGAYNMYIYGNVITGTQNCYDIDSRDCSKKNSRIIPKGYHPNTNNIITNNICSGYIRLCGSSVVVNNKCQFINNIQVGSNTIRRNVIKNVRNRERAIVYDSKAKIDNNGKVELIKAKRLIKINAPVLSIE